MGGVNRQPLWSRRSANFRRALRLDLIRTMLAARNTTIGLHPLGFCLLWLWLVACQPALTPTALPRLTPTPSATTASLPTPTLLIASPTPGAAMTPTPQATPWQSQLPSPPLRLAWPPGAAKFQVRGVALPPAGASYTFPALAGQRATVDLTAEDEAADFSLTGVDDGQVYKSLNEAGRTWSGPLSQSQAYLLTIQVSQAVVFTLSVSLAGGEAPVLPDQTPTAQPVAAAVYVSVAGWSPDSQWLAYWLTTDPEAPAQALGGMPGGVLHFTNIVTGALCPTTLTTQQDGEGSVVWSPDNQVQVTTAAGVVMGAPCQTTPFTPTAPESPPALPDPAVSPGGQYQAATRLLESANGRLSFETRLLARPDGAELAQVNWQIDERLGDYAGWLGGEWVSPTQFVIVETSDQGPLVLDTTGRVTSIARDVLGLSTIPDLSGAAGYQWWAKPVPGSALDRYHLLLGGVGQEDRFPLLRLYHSESGLVETLPYWYVWPMGVSADSPWLLLDERLTVNGYETHAVRWREIEDVGGVWRPLAYDVDSMLWSADNTALVYTQAETRLIWQTFPGGDEIGSWDAGPYWVTPINFAPNGRYVAAVGTRPDEWAYALFVVGMPP